MKFYHPPWNYHSPRKWMVGRCWKTLLSFWDAIFSDPMLVSGRATLRESIGMGPLGANYTPLLPWSMIEAAGTFNQTCSAQNYTEQTSSRTADLSRHRLTTDPSAKITTNDHTVASLSSSRSAELLPPYGVLHRVEHCTAATVPQIEMSSGM